MNYKAAKKLLDENPNLIGKTYPVVIRGAVKTNKIELVLISPNYLWGKINAEMIATKCDNETALVNLNLMEQYLEVLLISEPNGESTIITLRDYLKQPL